MPLSSSCLTPDSPELSEKPSHSRIPTPRKGAQDLPTVSRELRIEFLVNQAATGDLVVLASSSTSQSTSQSDPEQNGFRELLTRARDGDNLALGEMLEWYCNYLTILASTQLDDRLRRRVNPSDLVQETMMAAHRDFGAFRGESQPELLGWLRQILINTLHRTFARHVKAGKRDIRREISMDHIANQLEESACNLAALLPGDEESPSASMRAREDTVELANQLGKLRSQYRDVIVYRVLQGLSFDEIAERMDRSAGAVRMLWLRALDQFKRRCEIPND